MLALLDELSQGSTEVVAMAHNAEQVLPDSKDSITVFEGFPNEQEDRNRLVAYLKSKNCTISTLVQNQPFLLKPRQDDPNGLTN